MATQQVPGLTRTDLQHHDFSIPGREVIQNRVDIDTDAPAIRHWHPAIDGESARIVSAGVALTVRAERVHSVQNVGDGNAAELATYIVEKGRPLFNLPEEDSHV